MLKDDFYHELTKKYTVLFGTLFNGIYISRFNENDNVYSKMKIPIAYGSIEKHLARADRLTNEKGKNYAISFPRMSFEIESILYDVDRKLNRLNTFLSHETKKQIGMPIPYDINFSLTIAANRTEDGYQIVEQILPIFNPEFNISAKLIDEIPDLKLDIGIVLNSVSPQMEYEGSFEDRRVLRWNLDFTLKGYYFGNVSDTKIIKIVKTNFITDWDAGVPSERLVIYPGVDANGNPTTNPDEAIPYWQVNPDDNYDYVIEIDSFDEIDTPSANTGYLEPDANTVSNNEYPSIGDITFPVDFAGLRDGSVLVYDSSLKLFKVTTLLQKQTVNGGYY